MVNCCRDLTEVPAIFPLISNKLIVVNAIMLNIIESNNCE